MDDKVQCPRCGTTRLHLLKKLDGIDPLHGNRLANELRARRGDAIYHCIYCRLQFYDPRQPEPAPAPAQPEPEPEPPRPKQPRPSGTNVGAGVVIRGSIHTGEDIYIGGRVEGTLASQDHRVTIGPEAKVKANVRASELEVLGTLRGNSHVTGKMILRASAQVVGEIRAADLVVEDGAQLNASVEIIREQPRLPLA